VVPGLVSGRRKALCSRKEHTCGRKSFFRSEICLSASSSAFKAVVGCLVSMLTGMVRLISLSGFAKHGNKRSSRTSRDIFPVRADGIFNNSGSRIHW